MANKKSKKRYPPRITKYTALEYGISYHKNSITVGELISLRNKGVITDQDYCFLHEGVTKLAVDVAYGWWNNAALRENPGTRWAIEFRAKLVQEHIVEAFISKSNEEHSEENSG